LDILLHRPRGRLLEANGHLVQAFGGWDLNAKKKEFVFGQVEMARREVWCSGEKWLVWRGLVKAKQNRRIQGGREKRSRTGLGSCSMAVLLKVADGQSPAGVGKLHSLRPIALTIGAKMKATIADNPTVQVGMKEVNKGQRLPLNLARARHCGCPPLSTLASTGVP